MWYKVIDTVTGESLFIGKSLALVNRIRLKMGWVRTTKVIEIR